MSEHNHELDPKDEALQRITDAIQNYIDVWNDSDSPVMLDQAVVVWEQIKVDADGPMGRRCCWTIPTATFSLSSGVGLCEMGAEFMKRELIGVRVRDDDD